MTRGACTFRESDVKRALKAAFASGATTAKVEIDKDGKIIVVAEKSSEGAEPDTWRGVE